LATFNNSVVKPAIIADNNALSHLGRGDFVLPVSFSRGIMSGGILSVSPHSRLWQPTSEIFIFGTRQKLCNTVWCALFSPQITYTVW